MPPFPRHGLMVRVCVRATNGCTSVFETKLEGGGMRMGKCPGNGCASDATELILVAMRATWYAR